MSLVCFVSQKGSPGVTAISLSVAAALRPAEGRRKLLVEADGSGGALAARYRVPADPGLVTLAVAARGRPDPNDLWAHCQTLPGGLPAVLAPAEPMQVCSALDASGHALGTDLASRVDVDAIADVGRLWTGSPAVGLLSASTATLMVARPRPEELQSAAAQMASLQPHLGNLGWVLVGDKPYGAADVEKAFGWPVVSVVADDRRTVEAFAEGASPRKLRRQPFFRSCAALADTLATWLGPQGAAASPPSDSPALSDSPPRPDSPPPPPAPASPGSSLPPPPNALPNAPAPDFPYPPPLSGHPGPLGPQANDSFGQQPDGPWRSAS